VVNSPEIGRELPSATEEVAKLRLELHHKSLRELESEGVVEVDENDQRVREGPQFDDKWSAVFE
jgi:hypothetical protein